MRPLRSAASTASSHWTEQGSGIPLLVVHPSCALVIRQNALRLRICNVVYATARPAGQRRVLSGPTMLSSRCPSMTRSRLRSTEHSTPDRDHHAPQLQPRLRREVYSDAWSLTWPLPRHRESQNTVAPANTATHWCGTRSPGTASLRKVVLAKWLTEPRCCEVPAAIQKPQVRLQLNPYTRCPALIA